MKNNADLVCNVRLMPGDYLRSKQCLRDFSYTPPF
jgi:hypothetical protein